MSANDAYTNMHSGGGSSFISGYAGVNALKIGEYKNVRYIKDCINGNTSNTSNHWVEIQALKNGENVAKGKTVTGTTSQHSSYPYSRITDGSTATDTYAGPSSATGLQCVTIDLQEEYNLDKIMVWHYYKDGRSYNEHSLYTSDDNDTWTTIIDNRSGIPETSTGINANHSNNTLHYSGKKFINGKMEAGVNEGNGKVKISYVGESLTKNDNKLDNVRYVKDCINGNSLNTGNSWQELQAISNGINVAYGKTVTSTGTAYDSAHPFSALVDSDLNQSGKDAYLKETGLQCMTVDLEEEYDLDEVAVWHVWTDNRSYNEHSLYVSKNNSTWTTLIDNQNGVAETSNGIRYQRTYSAPSILYVGGKDNPEYINNQKTSVYFNLNNSNVTEYCVTESSVSDNCSWQNTYNKKVILKDFSLSQGDGEKTVYVYLKNENNEIVETLSDTIILDTIKPVIESVNQ